jgi:hypothetical protein
MNFSIFYSLLSLLPTCMLAGAVWLWRWMEDTRGLRAPVSEKLLRPAGESARKKTVELDEKIETVLLWVFGLPTALFTSYLISTHHTATPPAPVLPIYISVAVLIYLFLTVRLLRLMKERRNWRLGFSGERAVGEELNQLLPRGYHVFHDFPLAENWNIDHIVVGPAGVFALETKAKRKGRHAKNQLAHEVIYDGKVLQFPGYCDAKLLAQTKTQAERLATFLHSAIGPPVAVKPILTFPGWYVRYTSREVMNTVMNPKMLKSAIVSDEAPVLSPELIRQIVQQLDQKCRDIEF